MFYSFVEKLRKEIPKDWYWTFLGWQRLNIYITPTLWRNWNWDFSISFSSKDSAENYTKLWKGHFIDWFICTNYFNFICTNAFMVISIRTFVRVFCTINILYIYILEINQTMHDWYQLHGPIYLKDPQKSNWFTETFVWVQLCV